MEKVIETRIFKCRKCNEGEIVTTHEFDGEVNEVNIKKCSNPECKHQYHFVESLYAKLKKLR
jgi:hypothetical protein